MDGMRSDLMRWGEEKLFEGREKGLVGIVKRWGSLALGGIDFGCDGSGGF